jgi:DnaK suppressor protein
MDAKFLKEQEKLLKKHKKSLEKELLQVAEKKKTGEKYEPKFLEFGQREDESAQEVATYEEYLVLEKNLSKMLDDVNRALKKIEKGKYGLCEGCKKPIEKNRVKAIPTASLCLSCANKPKRGFRWAFWRR